MKEGLDSTLLAAHKLAQSAARRKELLYFVCDETPGRMRYANLLDSNAGVVWHDCSPGTDENHDASQQRADVVAPSLTQHWLATPISNDSSSNVSGTSGISDTTNSPNPYISCSYFGRGHSGELEEWRVMGKTFMELTRYREWCICRSQLYPQITFWFEVDRSPIYHTETGLTIQDAIQLVIYGTWTASLRDQLDTSTWSAGIAHSAWRQKSESAWVDEFNAWHSMQNMYLALSGLRVSLAIAQTSSIASSFKTGSTPGREVHRATESLVIVAKWSYGMQALDNFDEVIAIAVEDSIFISDYLTGDPIDLPRPIGYPAISRYAGSLGRPGITLLITPAKSITSSEAAKSWQLIDHEQYDGSEQTTFESFSVHLSPTGFETPLREHGFQEAETTLVEAAISLHDSKGVWIADLDTVLARDWCHSWLSWPTGDVSEHQARDETELLTIRNWAELLDPPEQNAVLLSGDEPTVRLAAVCLCLQRGYRFVVVDLDRLEWHSKNNSSDLLMSHEFAQYLYNSQSSNVARLSPQEGNSRVNKSLRAGPSKLAEGVGVIVIK